MGLSNAHSRALGTDSLPETVTLNGHAFRLEQTLKHTVLTAVGLYSRGGDRIVCKFHRQAPLFGLSMACWGRRWAQYESAVLRRLHRLAGAPGFRGMPGEAVVARDYVPGAPLTRQSQVGDTFFPQLFDLLDNMHARGIAYVDLEEAGNILVGEDGRPYLIDFHVASYLPRRLLGETAGARFLRGQFQRADVFHVHKHLRRLRRDLVPSDQWLQWRKRPYPHTSRQRVGEAVQQVAAVAEGR